MALQELSDRKKQILKAIVDAHIAGGEPVGSKVLMQQISCSSATYTDDGVDFCGIRIGSAVADVTAALGEPTEQNEQRVIYRDQTATLTFTLRGGYVSAIVLADNS